MNLKNKSSEIFIPDGLDEAQAIQRTTHMCIGAHQDDVEIMAYHGILQCFGNPDHWFGSVVVTDGAGSPRNGLYAAYSDEQMQQVRREEQKKAACIGEYGFQALLDYPSSAAKDATNNDIIEDLTSLIGKAKPQIVYTHNLADKHETHVSVALRTIEAIRQLPGESRPEKLYGCEVWRDLDWLTDEDKVPLDVSERENLASALIGVFDSQICGGKRYDLATLGRRKAHATYFASHGVDAASSLDFAMDMTPLIIDENLDPLTYISTKIQHFADEVADRVKRLRQ